MTALLYWLRFSTEPLTYGEAILSVAVFIALFAAEMTAFVFLTTRKNRKDNSK